MTRSNWADADGLNSVPGWAFILQTALKTLLAREKPDARSVQFAEANQADLGRPVLLRKTNRFACRANHLYNLALSRPDKRGVSRSSRTRDGMRWTRRHRKTNDAGLRTAKSCGPDAPTLASSLAETIREATVAKEPGHRGEHEVSR